MTTVFPTATDSLLNPSSSNTLNSPPHSAQHANANDAIEALEAKVGVDGSAVVTSLDYLVKQASNPGHTHTLYVPLSTVTAKGDLYVATASGVVTRRAVGSNDQVLTADSAQSDGVKWATPKADAATTKGDLLVHNGTTLIRRAVGTNGQVLTADSAEADGVKWATPAAPQTTFSPVDVLTEGMGQVGMMSANGTTGGAITGVLTLSAAVGAATTQTASSLADGLGLLQTSAATTGQQAYAEAGAAHTRADQLPQLTVKWKSGTVLTVVRMFVGLTASTVANELGGDAVINDKVGIQFSTARGDTNWQWVTCNGTTQTLADTGSAPVNFARFLHLKWTSTTSITATLRNSLGASITSATLTTTVPTSTAGMRVVCGIQTLENVAKSQTFYYAYQVTQPFAA